MSDSRYPGGPHRPRAYRPELEETTQLPVFSYQQEQYAGGAPSQGGVTRSPAVLWTLRVLGLLAVAVLSGLVWYYITSDGRSRGPAAPSSQASTGKYDFTVATQLPQPVRDKSCADHSTGAVQKFFAAHPCQGLARQLYTAKAPDGRVVYASVSVVQMASATDAQQLEVLTQKDGTGNVKDLVLEGAASLPPLKALNGNGGYASKQVDGKLVIVEADFATAPKHNQKDEDVLDDMCRDATRLGAGL